MAAITNVRFEDGIFGSLKIPSSPSKPDPSMQRTSDNIQILLRNGDVIDLHYIEGSSGAKLKAKDLKLLPKDQLKSLLKAAANYFNDPAVQFAQNGISHFTISSEGSRKYVEAVNDAVRYLQGIQQGPVKQLPGYRPLTLPSNLPHMPGLEFNIRRISQEILAKPYELPHPNITRATSASSLLGNIFYFIPLAYEKLSGVPWCQAMAIGNPVVHLIGHGAPPFYFASSIFTVWAAFKDYLEAKKIHDKEGQTDAKLQASQGIFLGAGTMAWAASILCKEWAIHQYGEAFFQSISLAADWLSYISYGFWGVGYAAALGKAWANQNECSAFLESIDSNFRNFCLPLQGRAQQTLLFLKDQISLTAEDMKSLCDEVMAEHPGATTAELQKLIEEKAKIELQSKLAHLRRKIGPECAQKIIDNVDKILSKLSISPDEALQEAVDLIQLVEKKTSDHRFAARIQMLINFIGIAISIALVFMTFSMAHLIGMAVLALITFITYYFNKRLNNTRLPS